MVQVRLCQMLLNYAILTALDNLQFLGLKILHLLGALICYQFTAGKGGRKATLGNEPHSISCGR